MIRKLAIGALVASAVVFSTGARAQESLPGVDLANSIVNDLTAPLRPLLTSDTAAAPAAPAAAPAAKEKHRAHKHHAKAHGAKHHVASRKSKHKAG